MQRMKHNSLSVASLAKYSLKKDAWLQELSVTEKDHNLTISISWFMIFGRSGHLHQVDASTTEFDMLVFSAQITMTTTRHETTTSGTSPYTE